MATTLASINPLCFICTKTITQWTAATKPTWDVRKFLLLMSTFNRALHKSLLYSDHGGVDYVVSKQWFWTQPISPLFLTLSPISSPPCADMKKQTKKKGKTEQSKLSNENLWSLWISLRRCQNVRFRLSCGIHMIHLLRFSLKINKCFYTFSSFSSRFSPCSVSARCAFKEAYLEWGWKEKFSKSLEVLCSTLWVLTLEEEQKHKIWS